MNVTRRQSLRVSIGMAAGMATMAAGLTGPVGAATPARSPGSSTAPLLPWRERVLLGFGTTLWLRAAHADAARADAALDAAVTELRAIESVMSLFRPDSQLRRLNAHRVLHRADPRLIDVLLTAQRVSRGSDGAFDVSVQPLWQLWQRARDEQRLPSAAELRTTRALVGWQGIALDGDTVRLRPGMALTLNGIAQGYAADRVKAVLLRHGIAQALVDTGEWASLAPENAAPGWRLGVADPHHAGRQLATLAADGRSIATSSDAQTVFTADHRHHHILDPMTGDSPTTLSSVTVLAPDCVMADALTKVFFVALRGTATLPATGHDNALTRRAAAMAAQWQVDLLLVDKRGRQWASKGLPLSG